MNIQFTKPIALGLCAVGLGGAGVAVASGATESSATTTAQTAPAFSGLPSSARAAVPAVVQGALDRAGAPRDAPTSVVDEGQSLVVIVQSDHTYLALHRKASSFTSIVDAPPESLDANAGTYVASGSAGGNALAALVPDGVTSASVTDDSSGSKTTVPAKGNVVYVERADGFKVDYDYNGKPGHAQALSRKAVPSP